MIVICPACKQSVRCADDASCVEDVPPHGECPGAGEIGFVLQFDVGEVPADWKPVVPKPDPRYRKEGSP